MKNSTYQPSGLAVLVTFLAFVGCVKEDHLTDIDMNNTPENNSEHVKLLQNPYEIHTFRKAYQKVLDSLDNGTFKKGQAYGHDKNSKKDTSEVQPNYLYIKFSPKTDGQESELRKHHNIVFLDYPFEYEDGRKFHKQNPLKEGDRLSFYASVPIESNYPKDMPHTILQEMYMPEKDENLNMDTKGDKKTRRGFVDDPVDFMNHVLEQAYVDTDNEELLPEKTPDTKGDRCETCFLGINLRGKWRPSGNVKLYDDNMGTTQYTVNECKTSYTYDYRPCHYGDYANCPQRIKKRTCKKVTKSKPGSYVPIAGAHILIRDTWTLDRAIADAQGNFRHKEVGAKVRYVIKWDRYQFSIRDHSGLFQAEDSGPKLYKQPWNLKISGGRMKYRGQIFQAAMHFYYHDIGGLTRPPTNGFWKTQIKIAAVETNEGPSSTKMQAGHGTFGIVPHIKIKRYGLSSEKIYGTTIHELAHAAHWRVDPISWDDLVEQGYLYNFGSSNPGPAGASARRLMESWATGVEIYLTRMRYRRLGAFSYEYRIRRANDPRTGNYQSEDINGERSKFYTSAVWDLLDDFNQRKEFGSPRPIDNASGFTMQQLEMNIIGAKSWNQFRNNILTRGRQKEQVIELFANWN